MTSEDLKIVEDTIERVVKAQVNGKIDRLTVKIDEHIVAHNLERKETEGFRDEVRELLKTKTGLTFLFKGVLGAGSLALAWTALKSVFPNL